MEPAVSVRASGRDGSGGIAVALTEAGIGRGVLVGGGVGEGSGVEVNLGVEVGLGVGVAIGVTAEAVVGVAVGEGGGVTVAVGLGEGGPLSLTLSRQTMEGALAPTEIRTRSAAAAPGLVALRVKPL